jgi:hypothetical protein
MMFTLLLRVFSGPQKILWLLGIAGVLVGVGTVTGWNARDYFADRKATKLLERQLEDERKKTSEWKRQADDYQAKVAVQNSEAAKREGERAASQTRADELSAQVLKLKSKLTTLEKASVRNEAGDLMCERTDPCHWLFINAAYEGTAVPAQCADSVPAQVRDKLLPDATVDR